MGAWDIGGTQGDGIGGHRRGHKWVIGGAWEWVNRGA